jgi:hypothetical protein
MKLRRTWVWGLALCGLWFAEPATACTGDCNGDREVTIDEIVRGVNMALDTLPVSNCVSFDQSGDGAVTVDEIVAAVNAALGGCPATSPTPSPAATTTATATNAPPVVTPQPIYRTYPGYPIALPLPIADPEGGPVQCSVPTLPEGGHFDASTNTFEWTPRDDQLGPFYVPFSCSDPAAAAAAGMITLKVQAPDACAVPSCNAASGCTAPLPPLDVNCCGNGPAARVAEPVAGCPAGLVLFVGENQEGPFGRLQNCDLKGVSNQRQTSAEVRLSIQARCVSMDDRPRLRARLETAKRVLFDRDYRIQTVPAENGFVQRIGIPFAVDRLSGFPDFTDIQGAEANLTVTLQDARNQVLTQTLRLLLTFTPVPELPGVDPTPTPIILAP